MQSEAFGQSTSTAISPPPTESTTSSQYGPDDSLFSLSDAPSGDAEGSTSGASRSGSESGGVAFENVKSVPVTPTRSGSTSPERRNRIAQYEALGASPSFGGAGFVVTRTDWSGKPSAESPISRFPNEVLIHALSFLDPSTLLTVSLISRRFNALVNSPHAWRAAFMQYFPPSYPESEDGESTLPSQSRRQFTSLSASESSTNVWRREYILRTRLLRSLNKGKAYAPDGASNNPNMGGLMVTYQAWLGHPSVSDMVASFSPAGVRCVHASLESQFVAASDPSTGQIEKRPRPTVERPFWNRLQVGPELRSIRNDHPDYAVAVDMNVNRVMDISEELGWIIGENAPDGCCYVHLYQNPYPADSFEGIKLRPVNENITGLKPLVTAVWIAKKRSGGVRETFDGDVGVIVGNSRGVLRVFKIVFSTTNNYLVPVADFCLSPGVPIVQIKVDDDFLPRRIKQRRPWIVVINALGEVYYLSERPRSAAVSDWKMVPQTARVPTPEYQKVFPTLGESKEELEKRQSEVNSQLMRMHWHNIQVLWEGCRMDWFVEVDWAGQNIVTGRKGSESYWYGSVVEKADAPLRRYHRRMGKPQPSGAFVRGVVHGSTPTGERQSIFGEVTAADDDVDAVDLEDDEEDSEVEVEWQVTELSCEGSSFTRITSMAMDNSILARVTPEDDSKAHKTPGGHGRLFAIGTNTGSIFVFNIRPVLNQPEAAELPISTIHTASPQITTMALSSLILVHGGDDGLVQAWDPLGSTSIPIRTLHSRYSAKARRRLEQNQGLAIADNQFAARCLILDPEPSNLRGIVALGTHIRYWSFSGTTNEGKKKRKKVGGSRRTSGQPHRSKLSIQKQIVDGSAQVKRERKEEEKRKEGLEKRYGVASGRAALSEEEMIAYATMISQETYEMESSGRSEVGSSVDSGSDSSRTVTPEGSVPDLPTVPEAEAVPTEDEELARALELSLQEVKTNGVSAEEEVWEDPSQFYEGDFSYPTPSRSPQLKSPAASASSSKRQSISSPRSISSRRYNWEKLTLDDAEQWPSIEGKKKGKGKESANRSPPPARASEYDEDLELAIQLSLQEQELRN